MSSERSSKAEQGVGKGSKRSCVQEAGGETRLLALKVEEGATSPGKWAPLEAGKDRETDSTLEPPEGTSPADPLILAHPWETSILQEWEVRHLWCLRGYVVVICCLSHGEGIQAP